MSPCIISELLVKWSTADCWNTREVQYRWVRPTQKQASTNDDAVAQLPTASLTFTHPALLLISWVTETSTNGNQPFSVSPAVHFRLLSLFWLVDTRPSDLHQGRGVGPSDGVGESCQVADSERARFVENSDGNQSDAGANILKCQVETLPCRDPYVSHFSVQFHDAVTNIHLKRRILEYINEICSELSALIHYELLLSYVWFSCFEHLAQSQMLWAKSDFSWTQR